MDELKALLPYGKDAALFCVCIYLIWTEFQDRKGERELKSKELDKKDNK